MFTLLKSEEGFECRKSILFEWNFIVCLSETFSNMKKAGTRNRRVEEAKVKGERERERFHVKERKEKRKLKEILKARVF